MRMFKLALAGALALVATAGTASALTVKKRTEAPGLPPVIWEIAGDWCSIEVWHPAVKSCEEVKEGALTRRILTLEDGGVIKETLIETSEHSYSYQIDESPLPVKNYKAKLWVELDDEPDRSVIYWQADFDAEGASDDDAKKTIADIFAAGIKGIKQIAVKQHADKDNDDNDDDD